MSQRFSTDIDREALKTHVRALIQGLGGIDAAAACTRITRSKLAEYADRNAPHRHMPVDVLLDLELAAGTPVVTQQIAGRQGFVLMPLNLGEGDVAAALGRVSRDAGATLADAMAALRDGLPAQDRARLVADLTELCAAGQAALSLLTPAPAALALRQVAP